MSQTRIQRIRLSFLFIKDLCSAVPNSLRPMDCSHQAPLSMRPTRQEYWSGLLCPSLGGASRCRDQTHIFCTGRRIPYH